MQAVSNPELRLFTGNVVVRRVGAAAGVSSAAAAILLSYFVPGSCKKPTTDTTGLCTFGDLLMEGDTVAPAA